MASASATAVVASATVVAVSATVVAVAAATAAAEVRNEADAPTAAAEGTAPPAVEATAAAAVDGTDNWDLHVDRTQ